MRIGVGTIAILLAGAALPNGGACAQTAPAATGPGQQAPQPQTPPPLDPQADQPIVPDQQFDAALPPISDDINAPLEPVPNPPQQQVQQVQPPAVQPTPPEAPLPPIEPPPPELAQPLPPITGYDVDPRADVADVDTGKKTEVRYVTVLEGLKEIGLDDDFRNFSALQSGGGKAETAAQVAARAAEDEKLAIRLMRSIGYYDGTAVATVEQNPPDTLRLRAVVSATPGKQYKLGSVKIVSGPTVPPGMLEENLPLKVGDPIDAARIQGAEANVSLRLPQRGYPFIEVGARDILLDEQTFTGDYTLPVNLGPRGVFGDFRLATGTRPGEAGATAAAAQAERDRRRGRRQRGQVFDEKHIAVLARFKRGELYDSRKVDDLRQALVSTGLFSSVGVEPRRTNEPGPDGTEYVDLQVRQNKGPPRTLAGTAGYSTGQGIRVEGTWTHRNLFPPEGALILNAVAGTQEQGLGATFRRSNAGQRDRTFQAVASINHADYDAYEAYTGTLSVRWSRDSTPIWQKHWTYFYGAELVGSNEDRWNFDSNRRDRGTWLIAAVPTFLGYDSSDNLLNPTKGFRLKLNASPETSVRGSIRPYARMMVEGTAYYPVSDSVVIAGRIRAGSIAGVDRNDLPPSRRYYGGGGGSVRGFGYQELGPRSPDGRPVGGRSLNEFAIEARYRFGNFGIVPFIDAGQVYESVLPKGKDIRFGAGIGGRFYTNFGPLRVDVATPINKKPGESRIALYISIGQAF